MLTAMSTTNAYCTLLLNRTWSMCFFLFFSSFLYFVRNQQIEFSFMEMHMIMRIYAYEKRNYIVNVNWSSINSWQLSFWQHKYCIYCIHLPFLCDWLFVVKLNLFHFHSFLSLSTSLTDLSCFFFSFTWWTDAIMQNIIELKSKEIEKKNILWANLQCILYICTFRHNE